MTQAERMRAAGKQQVLLWLSAESKARLEQLARERVQSPVAIVEQALMVLEGSQTAAPGQSINDQLNILESRCSALELTIKELSLSRRPKRSALPDSDTGVEKAAPKKRIRKPRPEDAVIAELAADGKSRVEIAAALNKAGYLTWNGRPYYPTHKAIVAAVPG